MSRDITLSGNINLSKGNINWGANVPNKKRYAASMSGPWHETIQSSDIYCCDWNYTTNAWGAAYKFVGTDGRPGSDASVPEYIKSTYIDATSVSSFHIKANKLEAICPRGSQSDTETGFILTGGFDNASLRYLRIHSYDGGNAPYTVFSSPQGCYATWDFPETNFFGDINFSAANVKGITPTFA